jgi:NADH dehydrogenase [ubiquinone] 1 alpha subcomplex assembly factor 1
MTPIPWRSIDDRVMGGVSRGMIVANGDGLRFQGVLSRRNNGGFASVRRSIDADLAGVTSFRLKVRGDGRRYQLRLRTDDDFDGLSWRALFDTGSSSLVVELRIEDFEPVFRGRRVDSAGRLDASLIRQIGFLLADGPEGEFWLEVDSVECLREI